MIAAAGLGSRLGHGLPKCMLEINGRVLLSRVIGALEPLVRKIHVVVGYREELVIDLCARLHRKVVIARNPRFRSTNTAESMALGARGCHGKTLFIDGDLLIDPRSLRTFVTLASRYAMLMGIAKRHSENPVCVELQETESTDYAVREFTRTKTTDYEWASLIAGPHGLMDDVKGYVFERLQQLTPIPACELSLREIDTESDLQAARSFAEELDAVPM